MSVPLEFGQPWALWLLLLLAPVGYLAWTTRAPLRRVRWWLSTLLRVALVLLVVLGLADARWAKRSRNLSVFFLVDGSKSAGPEALRKAKSLIEDEVAEMGKDDRFGVIVFGQRPLLRRALGPKGAFDLAPLDPVRLADFTNIGRAIRFAASQFPRDCQKRIVLLSDGNQNLGDAVEEARAAASGDVDVVTVPLAIRREAEVLVDSVVVPPRARPHQPIDLRASIHSSIATEVMVKVFRDHEQIGQGAVRLDPGPNVVHLADDVIDEPGFHRYEVLVETPAGIDAIKTNNTGLAYTQVYGEGRVLYLEGFPEHGRRLAAALEVGAARPKGGFSLETGTAAALPQTVEEMSRYDCIILSDVPASAMSLDQMTAIKHYVEHLGGGLIMIGGEKSLTTGGYLDTPVEEALPVSLHLEREKHLASLALAIVVDKSGSMGAPTATGATKMELANQACANAIDMLEDEDEAGVAMTDEVPKWVGGRGLRHMTATNKSHLRRDVLSAEPGGGGIYVKSGIYAAYEQLLRSRAQTRHIILFADACDSEQQNGCFEMARRHFQGDRITLTAVGLGSPGDPHVGFLRGLAEQQGGGRFYLTDNAHDLPKIFAKDTYIVSRNAIVEVPDGFRAVRTSAAEVIGNIDWRTAPPLYGYVATMPGKPNSEILLVAKDDEPLLARWHFGLGKATVFTSDAKDRWARDWARWPDFDRFWSQTVRWTMREAVRGNVSTQVVVQGNRGRVLVDWVDGEGRYVNGKMLSARVISPDPRIDPRKVVLRQSGPGQYTGEFDVDVTGAAYQVVVADEQQGAILDSVGTVLSYPPEYRDVAPDTALLNQVAEASGGQYLEVPRGTFQPKAKAASALRSIWVGLLVAATALLVLDIAARRLVLPDWLARRREEARRRLAQGTGAVVAHLRAGRDERRRRRDELESLPGMAAGDERPLIEPPQLKASPPGDAAEGDDDVVPLRPAGSSQEGDAARETSATERLLAARRRSRGHRPGADDKTQS